MSELANPILCLGDSYTIGESVDPNDRWPSLLASQLRAEGLPVAAPRIIAKTGWTTDELLRQLEHVSLPRIYSLSTVMIGVNNQYRGRSVDDFGIDLECILSIAIESTHGGCDCVICISIPDWGVTPFAADRDRIEIAREIDNFNKVARQSAANLKVAWADVTPCSRLAESDAELIAEDGLHPSATMHARWSDVLLPFAKTILCG